jgi:GABA permease
MLIALSQLRLRRHLERDAPEKLVVRMWAYPWLTYAALAIMALNLVAMGFIPSQRVPLMVGVASGLIVLGAYGLRGLREHDQPRQRQRGDEIAGESLIVRD